MVLSYAADREIRAVFALGRIVNSCGRGQLYARTALYVRFFLGVTADGRPDANAEGRLPRVFTRFWRADSNTMAVSNGAQETSANEVET